MLKMYHVLQVQAGMQGASNGSIQALPYPKPTRADFSFLSAGASIVASPLIALSLLAPEYQQSFAALLIGFALSETWRAPAAVLIREVSPPELGATGSALHLCIRNLVGGCGPLSKPIYCFMYCLLLMLSTLLCGSHRLSAAPLHTQLGGGLRTT